MRKLWKKREDVELISPTPKAERKIEEILKEDKAMIDVIEATRMLNDALATAEEAGRALIEAIQGSVLDEST